MIDKYEALLKEYFDYSDSYILHALNEANGRDRMLGALTNKLYDKIMEKYEKIDFSTVSKSRGDITKIEKFDSLKECVEIIYQLVNEYKQDTYAVDVINTTIANLKDRTNMFRKAFNMNCGIGIMSYNTMALGVVECTNFLISACIEYIKSPNNDSFKIALDTVAYNNTKQNLLFESLEAFNVSCRSGEFDKAMEVALDTSLRKYHEAAEDIDVEYDMPFIDANDQDAEYVPPQKSDYTHGTMVNDLDNEDRDDYDEPHPMDSDEDESIDNNRVIVHDVKEAGTPVSDFLNRMSNIKTAKDVFIDTDSDIGTAGQISQLLARAYFFFTKALIPALRNLVYFYYSSRQKRSDYYNDQAQLLQMHMLELQQDTSIDVERKKKILEKQDKIYQNYIKKRDKYAINFNVARKSVEKMTKDEDKKFDSDNFNANSPSYNAKDSVLF